MRQIAEKAFAEGKGRDIHLCNILDIITYRSKQKEKEKKRKNINTNTKQKSA
ncbi:hypothetical protein M413DRAFT_344955 [Hebeloma cylindrosporum]|uniref:Uncharacterized protein n=1 Tax=Hebeloma cylindrosporum TaxID=76867 RepID=A0A0C3CPE6_HEBCY|nr:hypothetical protein M413DRAFT_344955 [Hebeloma cylindrosporum h7]